MLPLSLEVALEEALGRRPLRVAPLGGGMICRAARIDLVDGPTIFLKWSDDAPRGLFSSEAYSLRALRAACAASGVLRVPQVLAVGEEPAFLALEFTAECRPTDRAQSSLQFGAALAQLHRDHSASRFGWPENNYLGRLPQRNDEHDHWPDFFRECRLLPQIKRAQEGGVLPPRSAALLARVVENLPLLLGDFAARPALLHGDLWSGNYFRSEVDGQQQTVFFDPACSFGEREMELALCELFGGFDAEFFTGYNEEYSLQAGYEARRPLHQLYHLLNHLNHFGKGYGSAVEEAALRALQARDLEK